MKVLVNYKCALGKIPVAMTEKVERIINLFDLISEHAPTDYELFRAGEETLINTIDVAHILGQPISSEALVDRYMALPIKKVFGIGN